LRVEKSWDILGLMRPKNKKVIVGMSGGVDSSVALMLLKKQGFEPIGITLKLPIWRNKLNACRNNVCCTPESIEVTKIICHKLQVPYFVIDAQKEFQQQVMKYFVKELRKYHTPNPCLICNRDLKFSLLLQLAKKMKISYVATGHYARVKFNKKTSFYELLKGRDKNKDQSYSLSLLTQRQLKHIILPLGNYTKAEVYKIAKQEGFPFFEKIKQSQNFCFVSNRALPLFIKKEIGKKSGPIVDLKGNVLGTHQGLYFYTIGQRKGLKLSKGPYYVKEFDINRNVLIVTKNKKDLLKKEVLISNYHFISGQIPKKELRVKARIRSHQNLTSASLFPPKQGKMKILFDETQRAVTPGQFCVFYQKNTCLGGGVII
jgi:tRNA-specific 2-thiouridylase